MERKTAKLGSCRHLLAHCRQLFSAYAHCPTRTRILGMDAFRVCMDLCHCGHYRQPQAVEGTFTSRNLLFRGNGPIDTRGFQAAHQHRLGSCRDMDYCRGGGIYHRSSILFIKQTSIYALRVPLLRTGWFCMPYLCSLGCFDHNVTIHKNIPCIFFCKKIPKSLAVPQKMLTFALAKSID